jgi:hypothetical protein
MATLQAIEKKAAEAHGRMRAIALLLEEKQASTDALEAKATAASTKLALTTASSSMSPSPSTKGDVVVIATLHA